MWLIDQLYTKLGKGEGRPLLAPGSALPAIACSKSKLEPEFSSPTKSRSVLRGANEFRSRQNEKQML